jgi:hypothetical protein
VYDELLARAAVPPFRDAAERRRRAFFGRTGQLGDDHPAFAARLAAAWEDALVGRNGGIGASASASCLADTLGETLEDEAERDIAHLLARGQRGLFELCAEGEHRFVHDHLGGGSFLLLRGDPVGRSARGDAKSSRQGDADVGFVIGRVIGAYDGCTLLPGLVWLPAEASSLLPALLAEARQRQLGRDEILDALLRMDHALMTLSRVKVSFAFRAASLPPAHETPREA